MNAWMPIGQWVERAAKGDAQPVTLWQTRRKWQDGRWSDWIDISADVEFYRRQVGEHLELRALFTHPAPAPGLDGATIEACIKIVTQVCDRMDDCSVSHVAAVIEMDLLSLLNNGGARGE